MFLLQRRLLMTTSVAALSAATVAISDAETLAGSETDALAIVYTDNHFKATTGFNGSVYCIDSGTPANDYDSSPTTEAASYFTYTSPSPKMILHDDGVLKYAAHNLCLQSEDFSTTWLTYQATKTSTGMRENTNTDKHQIYQNVMAAAGATVTFSVEIEGENRTWAWISFDDSGDKRTWFDLSGSGSVGTSASGSSASIESIGDGYYKCSVTRTLTNASVNYIIGSATGDNVFAFAGNTSNGLNLRKAHLHRYPADTTYLKTTSAARYADPIEFNSSGTSLGLLAEPQRTNLALRSNAFSTSPWTTGQAVLGSAATTSPAGLSNAWSLTDDSATGTSAVYVDQGFTVSTSTTYTFSIYAKAKDLSWLAIATVFFTTPTNGNSYFNLSAGTVGTAAAGHALSIQAVGDGWYRCSITFTTDSSDTAGNIRVGLADGDGDNVVDRDGTSSVYIYGAQLEAGSATSPIETFGSTVTRAADPISKAVTAYEHSATVNSGMVEYVPKGSAATATVALRWDDGTANEVVSIGHDASGNIGLTVTDGGAAQTAPLTSGTVTNDATETIGFSWKANDFLLSDNGATAVADASGTLPTVTTLKIGSSGGPIYVKRILIVPVEKTAAEVEAYGAL